MWLFCQNEKETHKCSVWLHIVAMVTHCHYCWPHSAQLTVGPIYLRSCILNFMPLLWFHHKISKLSYCYLRLYVKWKILWQNIGIFKYDFRKMLASLYHTLDYSKCFVWPKSITEQICVPLDIWSPIINTSHT